MRYWAPNIIWTLRTGIDLSIALRRIDATRDDALALASDVHQRCLRLFGRGHPDTLAAAISLINIQRTLGQTERSADRGPGDDGSLPRCLRA